MVRSLSAIIFFWLYCAMSFSSKEDINLGIDFWLLLSMSFSFCFGVWATKKFAGLKAVFKTCENFGDKKALRF